MPPKHVAPAITLKAFSCPHCGAFAYQKWCCLHAESYRADKLPVIKASPPAAMRSINDRKNNVEFADKLNARELDVDSHSSEAYVNRVHNLHLSQCCSCDKSALWLHDKLLHPTPHLPVECNNDMPDEIRADFEEAREIFFLSPRGAAALLRLAVQKLCRKLGESGEHINDDIASLVKKGLSVKIQKALDIVRVIGNDAVHPGQIDLNDDQDTAASLFELVNLIIEEKISEPRRLEEMYSKLPASKRDAIAQRDGTAKSS